MDNRKKEIRSIIKYLLVLLFIGYYGSVSFFFHAHIIDGVTVIHSHPYSNTAEDSRDGASSSQHNHSAAELLLICVLNKTTFEEPAIIFPFHQPFFQFTEASIPRIASFFTNARFVEIPSRAPPVA